MSSIKLDKEFLDTEDNVLNAEKECCIQKANGDLAEVNGVLVTVMVPTPDRKIDLKTVCIQSLLTDIPNDETDKYEKYKLFQKFHKANGKIELDSKEIELVKGQIKKCYGILIFGQAFDMLEGK